MPLSIFLGVIIMVLAITTGGGPVLAGDPEDTVGKRISVDVNHLPKPYQTPSFSRPSVYIGGKPDPSKLKVAPGFGISIFAGGLEHPRNLRVDANGDVYLVQSFPGVVTRLRDRNGDGKAEERTQCKAGFSMPHGIAIHDGRLYIADTKAVWELAKDPCHGTIRQITPTGALGDGDGHWTRNLAFHPDGERFFVAIGSQSNIDKEPSPRATIREFALDGTDKGTFASGLRNPVGIVFRPGSHELWTVVNERDGLGDDLVPDYLTHVHQDAFYGWPYAYLGNHPQKPFEKEAAQIIHGSAKTTKKSAKKSKAASTRELKATSLTKPGSESASLPTEIQVPDFLFRSHSAPLGLVFYDHKAFPPDYHGDAFVALHGSWNAGKPRGYIVARVPFADGKPKGWYEAFVTGFRVNPGGSPARVMGRPAGLAVMTDGSLLIADDFAGVIWRVHHQGK